MWRRARRVDAVNLSALADARGVYLLTSSGHVFFVGGSASLRRRAVAYQCSQWLDARDDVELASVAPGQMRIKLSAPPIRHDLPAPMAETEFWRLLAEAKLIGPVESGLRICLGRRDPVVIAAFAARWQTLLSQLFNWQLWDVAYVMCGGCSNDSFEYFRSWIISQGESTANAAREDPVHWAMRLGQAPVPVDRYHFNAELPSYVGFDVYASRTGASLTRAWPDIDATPSGTQTVEAEIFDTYPQLTRTWHPPSA